MEFEIPEGVDPKVFKKALQQAAKQATPHNSNDLVVFAEIPSGHEQLVRVYRDIFNGREMLSIRRFYIDHKDGDQVKPGKGVTFHDEDIDEIIEGLQKMNQWVVDNAPGGKDFRQCDD